MRQTIRNVFPYFALLLFVAGIVWAVSFESLPQADFTFVNGTEVASIDPAIVTGIPEGRVIYCLSEGLLGLDPKTLVATTENHGASERYEVSDDGLTYTFYLRPQATWSNGDPLTAADFWWSFRRVLHPETASEYAYQLYYVRRAKAYNQGVVEVGDRVEIELPPRPHPGQLFPRGKLVYGEVKQIDKTDPKSPVYEVDVQGKFRKFSRTPTGDGVEEALGVLIDFKREVGFKVLSDKVLQITLENPTPYFPKLMSFYPLFPVHRDTVEKYGYPDFTKPEHLVVNGPFVLEFRRIRDRIRLRKNPRYWNADYVKLRTIDVLAVGSDQTGLNLYLSGKVDWIYTVPNSMIPLLYERDDFNPEPYLGTYFYRLNVTRKPLDDPRVRKALSLAIDRTQIVETITQAQEIPSGAFVPANMAGYHSPQAPLYDPELARKLLAEAGYPGGKDFPRIEILFNTLEAHKQIAEFIQKQWKQNLGIDAGLVNQEWASYLETQRHKQYYVSRAGWIGDYADPNTFLDMFVTDGANNQTGWGNAKYDQLIAQATTELDPAQRMKLLEQAEAILLEELPIIPLYHYSTKNMVRPYVQGFYNNILDVHPLHHLRIDEKAKAEMAREGWK